MTRLVPVFVINAAIALAAFLPSRMLYEYLAQESDASLMTSFINVTEAFVSAFFSLITNTLSPEWVSLLSHFTRSLYCVPCEVGA